MSCHGALRRDRRRGGGPFWYGPGGGESQRRHLLEKPERPRYRWRDRDVLPSGDAAPRAKPRAVPADGHHHAPDAARARIGSGGAVAERWNDESPDPPWYGSPRLMCAKASVSGGFACPTGGPEQTWRLTAARCGDQVARF